jgi:hypothetical protein
LKLLSAYFENWLFSDFLRNHQILYNIGFQGKKLNTKLFPRLRSEKKALGGAASTLKPYFSDNMLSEKCPQGPITVKPI